MNLKDLFKRAVDLMKENANQEAESVCLQALETDPSDVNFIALLGTSLMRQGKLNEAEQTLRRVVKIAPGFPRAQEDLGTALLNLKKPSEAIP
ncbi:MAG: tetratricopeptide repeat protein, partial [Halieaceae bacterium]|nr:tetratricopeptide repeat protein [Halieaceae bacterium]